MNKTEIVKRLRESYGSDFLSLNKVASALGVGKTSAKRILDGVYYLPNGNSRRYLVDDVAKAIVERRQA